MSYRSKYATDKTDALFQAILELRDLDDCYRFFEDICTASEVVAMSQRLDVAKMLTEGCTYQDIVTQTGVSSATISRVKRCLEYGADGYTRVLERLDESETNDTK